MNLVSMKIYFADKNSSKNENWKEERIANKYKKKKSDLWSQKNKKIK